MKTPAEPDLFTPATAPDALPEHPTAAACAAHIRAAAAHYPVAERVAIYNALTKELAAMVGFPHPVLAPQLIPIDQVQANDYNPNKVAPPERQLLKLSMRRDGVTMAVVVADNPELGCTVVDGFHRTDTIRNDRELRESLHGYIPVVKLNKDLENRIASTVRHNMARGSHLTELSSKLVLMLRDHNWSDTRIGKELGMQPDEVLRLKQITGLADAFADRDFSRAWE